MLNPMGPVIYLLSLFSFSFSGSSSSTVHKILELFSAGLSLHPTTCSPKVYILTVHADNSEAPLSAPELSLELHASVSSDLFRIWHT